jgi:hypothetical protein
LCLRQNPHPLVCHSGEVRLHPKTLGRRRISGWGGCYVFKVSYFGIRICLLFGACLLLIPLPAACVKIPLPPLSRQCYLTLMVKRPRGGQKGNQNARVHGFYSTTLEPREMYRFWNIVNQQAVDPEIAALTVKLRSLIQVDRDNRRALGEAAKLLGKWYSAKHGLSKTDSRSLNRVIFATIVEPAAQLSRPPVNPLGTNE